MIVQLRKNAGRAWVLLVAVPDFGPEATVGALLEARSAMRLLGDAFVREFTSGDLVGRINSSHQNLRADHYSLHMWLHLERLDWHDHKYPLLGEAEHERVMGFFDERGLDVVGYR